jgi:hypothetical protein
MRIMIASNTLNDKKYKQGAVAHSEHVIVLAKKATIGLLTV